MYINVSCRTLDEYIAIREAVKTMSGVFIYYQSFSLIVLGFYV